MGLMGTTAERARQQVAVATPRSRSTLIIEGLLRKGDLTYAQIAERYGISRQRVGELAHRIGIHRKPRRQRVDGAPSAA